ncbi:hypothetical protein BTHI11S_00773 [Bosea thiooxidans]
MDDPVQGGQVEGVERLARARANTGDMAISLTRSG